VTHHGVPRRSYPPRGRAAPNSSRRLGPAFAIRVPSGPGLRRRARVLDHNRLACVDPRRLAAGASFCTGMGIKLHDALPFPRAQRIPIANGVVGSQVPSRLRSGHRVDRHRGESNGREGIVARSRVRFPDPSRPGRVGTAAQCTASVAVLHDASRRHCDHCAPPPCARSCIPPSWMIRHVPDPRRNRLCLGRRFPRERTRHKEHVCTIQRKVGLDP
jgi:hypothetical protein